MKYTIEIPTVDTLETLVATAHRKGQKWLLENIAAEMENQANLGFYSYTQELSKCPYTLDQGDVNEVQNTLREMGYLTTHYPRRGELIVDWSPKARKDLQALKDNHCAWRFPTKADMEKRAAELNAILGK